MTHPIPSPEQVHALVSYASRNGRTWKSKLVEAWSNGRDEREPESAELRSVRNTFGPTWLFDRFKLPKN
jgi:hypothetical protein